MAEPADPPAPVIAAPRLEGGLWCDEVLALLPALLEGSADPAAAAQAQAHVAACGACAAFGGRYAAGVAALRAAAPAPLPAAARDRLNARLAAILG
ncbi:MAG: hypothetical protein RL071_2980 [Pseudomonadota bacterium]